ncbi:MAG: hypothetical protein WKF71_19975 [Pyrinomonadaceae bacterium]
MRAIKTIKRKQFQMPTLRHKNRTMRRLFQAIRKLRKMYNPRRRPKSNSGASASDSSPMAKPIDVAEMTVDIEKAEKEFDA